MQELLRCRKDAKLETCIIDDNTLDPNWEMPKVVIVGAGLAGLSAAHKLASSGLTNITVLEATERAGGRIHSCWMGDVVTEIGAEFIEGTGISNSAFTLASQGGLIKPPFMKESLNGITMTCDGDLVSPFVSSAANIAFNSIVQDASDLFLKCGPGSQCGNLLDFILNRIDKDIQIFSYEEKAKAAKVMISRVLDLVSKVGSELDYVSACQFGTLVKIPGGNVRLPRGMVGMLAPLLKGMPECDTIRYCKPVSKIVYCEEAEERIQVYCCDGDIICADFVIVTVPLGVLKDKLDSMFFPKLTENKIKAIGEMNFGHVNHVYLEYAQPFWVWNEGSLRMGWNLNEIGHNWTRYISSISELPTSQQILKFTIGGLGAIEIEELSDAQIAEEITKLHRHFLKNSTLPYPANIIKSKWSGSQYFRGAKSYFGLNTTISTQCELTRPIPDECGVQIPALLFAGEATAIGAQGTLHGARNSGLREAERIINITKKFRGKPRQVEANADEKAVAKL